ncbi:MAG: SHOCT domain-containing protein [Candidatus Hodarchaeales archaeon]|jgi:hypothetical protein
MSEVGSGLIKLAYRGVAGFIVLLLMFVLGVTGIALSFAGGVLIAVCWIPLAYPEILNEVNILVIAGNGTNDPVIATAALLIVGIFVLAIGFFFIVLTYFIGKGAIEVDKEISYAIDRAFMSSGKDRISQLERLAVLRDSGILTEAEFEQEKNLILDTHPYLKGKTSEEELVDK